MKCPSCGYFHGVEGESFEWVEGSEGDFYILPMLLERRAEHWPYKEYVEVCGCPSCNSIFMEV